MKIKSFFALSILMALVQSLTASDKVMITGNIGAIPDSTEVILFHHEGRAGMGIATDTVINGRFLLSVPVNLINE